MIFVRINWGSVGGFYFFPVELQLEIFQILGREKYIKLPKQGTNPRGVEITSIALKVLIENKNSYKIEVNWQKVKIDYNPYQKWIELWEGD